MGYRIFLLLALLQFGSTAAFAQDGTSGPDVACAVEPRSMEELLDLWFDPAGTPAPAPPSAFELTDMGDVDIALGEPADAATVDAINTVTQEWVACRNAGDYPRLYALGTDDFALRQRLQGDSLDEVRATLEAPPTPVSPESRWMLSPAHDVRILPDGRIGATFTATGVRQPEIAYGMYIAFEQQDSHWLLDALTLVSVPNQVAPVWDYDVVATYPHDPDAFTQGLAFDNGELFEGTGQRGESELRRVDLETGSVLQSRPLDDEYFGEGIAIVGDRIYQLTWQAQTGFVYDRESFELLETFTYPTEGWGLTWDGDRLIMSDGSSRIFFRDPETFEEIGVIDVTDGGMPVSNLNELEFIDGEIWANVYQTDLIARIDPATGDVTGWIDLAGLLDPQEEPVDVLNGIAYEPESGRVIVTGKYWPTLFEIELIPPE